MFKKWALRLIAPLAVAIAALGLTAVPAMAATYKNCPSNYVCLYQWVNQAGPSGYANPGWKSTLSNLDNAPNGCINLTSPYAYWGDGNPVPDNSGSIVVNGGAYHGQDIVLFDWVNCNYSGGYYDGFDGALTSEASTLANVPMAGASGNAYHRVTSIGMTGLP